MAALFPGCMRLTPARYNNDNSFDALGTDLRISYRLPALPYYQIMRYCQHWSDDERIIQFDRPDVERKEVTSDRTMACLDDIVCNIAEKTSH